jgi:acetolactate synthase-1/2/3 large subunit
MSTEYTVSDLIADFLVQCDVDTAFGVVSVHNIPMLDSISQGNRIRFVMARGELGASHMADGYGRASKKLGVLITSTGPGAANAVTGLVEARFASTPLLHITGQTMTKFVDRGMGSVHDIPDQLGLMKSAGKSAYRIRTPTDAFAVLRQAVADAMSFPPGPVTVEVPIDIQRMPVARPAGLALYTLPSPVAPAPISADLEALAERVAGARRPMLWLGRGAARAGAQARQLLDLGFAMVTSMAGRGVVSDDHPMNLGALNGGGGVAIVEDFYKSVDLMLVVGSRLRGHETQDFSLVLPKQMIQIDLDPRADGRTYANSGFINGDAGKVLDGLIDMIRTRMNVDPAFRDDFVRLKRDARESFKASLGPYATFSDQLRAVMPENAIWARDITINNSTWGNKLFPLHDTSTNVYPIGGGIGEGLCLGIGASLSPGGRKTVVLIGDGGFALNLGELWTAIQDKLDMVIIVANDNGYGVIRQIQDKTAGGRRRFDDLLSPDLKELAKVAGLPFWRVAKAEDFGATVAQAIAVRGPTMVEVDMTAIGDHPPYYPFGPKITALGATT